jgi:hypothetical protein
VFAEAHCSNDVSFFPLTLRQHNCSAREVKLSNVEVITVTSLSTKLSLCLPSTAYIQIHGMVVIPLFLMFLSFKKGSCPDCSGVAGKREVVTAAVGRHERWPSSAGRRWTGWRPPSAAYSLCEKEEAESRSKGRCMSNSDRCFFNKSGMCDQVLIG